MSGSVIVMGLVLLAAVVMVVSAVRVRRARRRPPLPTRDCWDEDAQRWTARDAGLDLRFLEELDAHLTTYANQDPDLHEAFGTGHTTTPEGD